MEPYAALLAVVAFLIGVCLIYIVLKVMWKLISWVGRLIFCRGCDQSPQETPGQAAMAQLDKLSEQLLTDIIKSGR